MKITIFIFLSILFSLNQVKNLSIHNHDLTVNKKSVDKYHEVNNGIEKKNRRQYFFNIKFINFFFVYLYIQLVCGVYAVGHQEKKKKKKKKKKEGFKFYEKNFKF